MEIKEHKVAALAISILIFGIMPCMAQMQLGLNKDSLRRVLTRMPDDTNKVKTYITLGQQYESQQPDTAIRYYKLAGQLSERLNYPLGITRYIANYTAVLNVQGKFDESLQLNLRAVEVSRKAGLTQQLVKALMNAGAVYQYKEDYQHAVIYYLKALPLLETGVSNQNLSLAYGNLCGLYRDLKQPARSLNYGRLSLKYAQKDHDDYTIARAYINIANALKDFGQISQSISYLRRAEEMGRQIDDDNTRETALIDLGDAYLQLRQPAQYMEAYKKALPLARTNGDVSGQAFALQGISLGLFWKKQYKQADRQLTEAIAFAKKYDQKGPLANMLMLMSDVQIALGRPEMSMGYRNQYDSVSNILLNAPLLKNIQELETRYGVEKKQKEILQKNLLLEQKDRDAQKQRQLLFLACSGVLLLVLIVLLVYRFYRQRRLLDAKALEVLKAEQESERLKAVLEGEQQERRRISQEMHDDMGAGLTRMLFLSRAMPAENDGVKKIGDAAEDLIRKMNEAIWTMNNEQDTLDSLLAYIRAGSAEMLEQANIDLEFIAPATVPQISLNREFRRHMYLAVKEAVHNAIKHSGGSRVVITVQFIKELSICIKDDGKGISENAQKRFGNGMGNMRSRIMRLNGEMKISTGQGTEICFVVPLPL